MRDAEQQLHVRVWSVGEMSGLEIEVTTSFEGRKVLDGKKVDQGNTLRYSLDSPQAQ